MSKRFRGAVLLALAWVAGSAAATAAAPTPYTAEYEVLRNGSLMGRGTVTLQCDADGIWQLRSLTRGTKGMAGLAGAEILEESRLRWVDDQPLSQSYRYRQELAWRSRERSRHGRACCCSTSRSPRST